VRTTEELLERKSGGSGLENRDYLPWESVALTTRHLYPQTLALTSPASGGHSVGIVRSPTKATEFSFFLFNASKCSNEEVMLHVIRKHKLTSEEG
jgi:hypothetical protein